MTEMKPFGENKEKKIISTKLRLN